MVVFGLFEKLRDQLNLRVLTENASTSDLEEGNDKRIALQTLPKIDTEFVWIG